VPEQQGLVEFGGNKTFLSGGNIAWHSFARDIGPAEDHPKVETFERIFESVEEHGGNTLRLWLHTNGAHTPAWDGSTVTGPGENTIPDLRKLLDAAEQSDIGLILCLWSFDMLRKSYGQEVTDRSYELLTERSKTESYIDNALIPMVDAVGGHPALTAFEIFNEPEMMSEKFGWSKIRQVSMDDIQRFINQTAGAIHRTEPEAKVTVGAWSFTSLTDESIFGFMMRRSSLDRRRPTGRTIERIQMHFSRGPRPKLSKEGAYSFYRASGNWRWWANNYYRDDRLKEAGGDPKGTLDFYSVHYYEWAETHNSPFHNEVGEWELDKPVVVGEFFMGPSHGNGDSDPGEIYGVDWKNLYGRLARKGYGGALGWQWYDWHVDNPKLDKNWPRALDNMERLEAAYPDLVSVELGLQSAE
jgi:hypothetical protein